MSLVITVHRPGDCLTCDEPIEDGHQAHWEPEVGIWCLTCPEPRNLQHYIRERDRKKAVRSLKEEPV